MDDRFTVLFDFLSFSSPVLVDSLISQLWKATNVFLENKKCVVCEHSYEELFIFVFVHIYIVLF